MKRRNLFAVLGAALALPLVGRSERVRYVQFNAPRETPSIYWMTGHQTTEMFTMLMVEAGASMEGMHIVRGWGTKKLDGIGIYLSDTPQANFEPITYWIPSDHIAKEAIS